MGADSSSHAYNHCQMRVAWSNCCMMAHIHC